MEEAGFGGSAAAPVARRIWEGSPARQDHAGRVEPSTGGDVPTEWTDCRDPASARAGATRRRRGATSTSSLLASVVAIAVARAADGLLGDPPEARAGRRPRPRLLPQAPGLFVLLGVGVMALVAVVDYRVFRDFAPVIYVGSDRRCCWSCCRRSGRRARGTQAWFQLGPFQLQPSEFAKLAVIICLAAYCVASPGRARRRTAR